MFCCLLGQANPYQENFKKLECFSASPTQTSTCGTKGIVHSSLKCKRNLSNLKRILFPSSQEALSTSENQQFLFVKWHDGLLLFNTLDPVRKQEHSVWSAIQTQNERLFPARNSCNWNASTALRSVAALTTVLESHRQSFSALLCCYQPCKWSSWMQWVTKQFLPLRINVPAGTPMI